MEDVFHGVVVSRLPRFNHGPDIHVVLEDVADESFIGMFLLMLLKHFSQMSGVHQHGVEVVSGHKSSVFWVLVPGCVHCVDVGSGGEDKVVDTVGLSPWVHSLLTHEDVLNTPLLD